jgi:hypothetical protein
MRRRWEAMKSEDPWEGMAPPHAAEVVTARRVDANIPWGFFWAVDLEGRCLLLLQHGADSQPRGRLPRLNGIEVAARSPGDGKPTVLTFRLLASTHRDIFQRLCRDIVDGAAAAMSEKEAVGVALARTWRWHYLLRGGGDGRLSLEEQKGLIGEFLVLEKLLLPHLPAGDALAAWHGPLGAPKDFEMGGVCIEAKARRGGASPYVTINSENQLDTSGVDAVFLHVAEVHQAPSDLERGFSITDTARRIRDVIDANDPGAVQTYEDLLQAAGLKWDDDYSDTRWVEGHNQIYRIAGNFPRLVPSQIPAGVSRVRYAVSLVECEPYLATAGDLIDAMKGFTNVA